MEHVNRMMNAIHTAAKNHFSKEEKAEKDHGAKDVVVVQEVSEGEML